MTPLPNKPQAVSPVLKFLVSLTKDVSLYSAFQTTPDKTMKDAGLPFFEQELLQSGDGKRIQDYLYEQEPDSFPALSLTVSPPLVESNVPTTQINSPTQKE